MKWVGHKPCEGKTKAVYKILSEEITMRDSFDTWL